ncbi:MAG: hypothetical protein KDC92_16985 [Bacteroidetes bacterium]|nr:hypothetical protein [Bacteroidota bacterium]
MSDENNNIIEIPTKKMANHKDGEVVTINKGGRPTDYDPSYCERLIKHMESGLSYEAFAGELGVAKQTIYNWEKAHPEFLDAKRVGASKSQLFWEKAGVHGMFMGGKDNPFNATVWVFNMKNRFGWRDRVEQTHSVSEETKKLVINIAK